MEVSLRFKDLEPPVKHNVVQEFLNEASAPEELRRWAHMV